MWLHLLGLLGILFIFRWFRYRQIVPDLFDKYVLITGCGSGFGNLLAKQLDHRGLRVLAACHSEESAKLLKDQTSQKLQTVVVEVADSDSVVSMTEWVKEQIGNQGLWGLVNNAGVTFPTCPNEWLTKSDFQRILDINLLGLIDVTLNLTPLVRKAQGRIVNLSSVTGRLSLVGGGYCISKYGLEAFSDSLRRELRPFGVKVILIEPGFFLTALTSFNSLYGGFVYGYEQSSPEIQQSYGRDYLKYFEKALPEVKQSSKLELVTDYLEHALTAQYPCTRYSPGWDAKLTYIPLSYFPTWFSDVFLTHAYPLPSEHA